MDWSAKTVVLGVSGGIACYKAAAIASALRQQGADVHVVMTRNAAEFVTPLTFETLSRNRVVVGMFDEKLEWEIDHIALADRADMVIIAPATANVIGKIAGGIADDSLTALVMATRAPVLIAPSMNVHMYENPIVQANVAKLRDLGYHFVDPAEGMLACGYEGKGRLAEPEDIVARAAGIAGIEK
jgi:phosphopantothenoylcysteine decarboxylase/phosphopantothenate--cysteine ligase